MATPILATKLHIPTPRPKAVLRPRLIERLNQGLQTDRAPGVTLISAPAGFGKTTVLSEWVNQKHEGGRRKDELGQDGQHPSSFSLRPFRVAWLSLDEGDNDLTRLLVYVIAALQTTGANIGEALLDLLQASPPQPPPTESILTALLNEIAAIPDDFILVLDDYHVLEAKPVDQALAFLLEHLPPKMHLVIATREDPRLPLARYRARGQLTELRAADLRFTPSEAAEFLNQVMGLKLSGEDVAALEARTEGWIAGLQLAALGLRGSMSMPGQPDATRFIQSFTGSHPFVLDYLLEEVLQRQLERIQTFLLRTSILDRLCGPLCDAVLGESEDGSLKDEIEAAVQPSSYSLHPQRPQCSLLGSASILEYLERANLLVVPLDDQREWYRYHHLFADALRARLVKEQPNLLADLHLRACEWYEQNNFRYDAIRHALAARDFARAADLIELELSASNGIEFRSATRLGWVKALPDELVRARPGLSVGFAWELLFLGELEAAEARLRDAEHLLEPAASITGPPEEATTTMLGVSDETSGSLRASLAIGRAFLAQALGDIAGTAQHARRALTLVPETDHATRGLACSQLALACWTTGDLESAGQYMADALVHLRAVGNLLFATTCAYVLADITAARGRLRDAAQVYEEALQLVTARGEPLPQGTSDLYLGLSELCREQGHVETAGQHLLRAAELGRRAALPDWPYGLYLVQARVFVDQADYDGAVELLDKAEPLYHRTPVPNLRPVAAMKIRVRIRQGRLAEALDWVQRQKLSANDEPNYLREFEHITLARLLIAGYQSDRSERSFQEAVGLLEHLLKAADDGERLRSVIEILVLQALALEAHGNISLALVPLERALTLAETEGYVRVFVTEGLPMVELLTRLNARRGGARPATSEGAHGHIHRLLVAFGKQKAIHPSSFILHPLFEPLSERELEVLRLLGTELNGPEISRQLLVSQNTMRTHTKNIYSKLGVNSRRAAVRRAEELNLL